VPPQDGNLLFRSIVLSLFSHVVLSVILTEERSFHFQLRQDRRRIDYPFHDKTIVVTNCGRICLGHKKINFSTVFAGQAVGITEHLAFRSLETTQQQ
jgi:hypothetical protein